MNPLSAIYSTVASARNRLYDNGSFRQRRLAGPVVSVGNISAGGSGKTPFVILLGELLQQRGIAFDVLSRGYGRKSRGVFLVDPNGSSRDFGDEPILIAKRLGCPVIVGGWTSMPEVFFARAFLQKVNSARNFTFSMTVFSTVHWRGISISFCSPLTM